MDNNNQQQIKAMLGRVQPQAIEMEQAVIGAVMLEKSAYPLVKDVLSSKDFYDPKNQLIWQSFERLSVDSKPIDMLSVIEDLTVRGQLHQAGDPVYIAELATGITSAANIEYHASVVKEKSSARHLLTLMGNYTNTLYFGTESSDDVITNIQASLAKMVKYKTTSDVYVVDPEHPAPDTEFLLSIKGVKCFPKADLTAFKAKAKSGKTQLCAITIAAAIARTEQAEDGGEKPMAVCGVVRNRVEPFRILFIDTEQSYASTCKLTRRILTMAGREYNKPCPYLNVINQRLQKKEDRLKFIETEVERGGYDMVFIDGIKDLAKDFNDNEESDHIIEQTLLPLMQKTLCCIATVLHENPSKDSDKMRGHLGTELCNKAFEVFQVSKNEDDSFKVETSERREPDVPEWSFKFEEREDGTSVLVECDGPQSESPKPLTKEERDWNVFVKAWEDNIDLSMTQKEIIDAHLKRGTLTRATCQNRIKAYAAQKRIIADGDSAKQSTRYGLSTEEKIALRGDIVPANSPMWEAASQDETLPF